MKPKSDRSSAMNINRNLRQPGAMLAGLLLALVSIPATALAQSGGDTVEQNRTNGKSRAALELPSELADGRALRAIAIFQSQMIDLVPKTYRAVGIKELADAINETLREQGGAGKSRLKSSFYDVRLRDGHLISQRDRSSIVIESDQPGSDRLSLGSANLAIVAKASVIPRLEFADNGELIALLPDSTSARGPATINFSWSLGGQSNGPYQDFDLRIPRTPETRIVLSTPVDVEVNALDGVLRSRPSIPAGAEPRSDEVRWYEIEAGGLSSIQLRTFRVADLADANMLITRRSILQYAVDSFAIRWRHMMTIQTRGGRTLPPLVVTGGLVTSVEVDQVSTSFETVADPSGTSLLNIQTTLGGSPATNRTTKITVTGEVASDSTAGWLSLPRTYWDQTDLIQTQVVDQIQVDLRKPLSMVFWELPEGWVRQPSSGRIHSAEGPPIDVGENDANRSSQSRSWSRIRLTNRVAIPSSKTLLTLGLTGKTANAEARIDAQARIRLKVDSKRISPLRLRVQPGWNQVAISFPTSGRIVDAPLVSRNSAQSGQFRLLTIWPEAEDISGGELRIDVTAQRPLAKLDGLTTVPATWLARVEAVRGELIAAVIPPTDLNWAGQAAMEPDRVAIEDLSESDAEFFGAIPEETLLLQPTFGSTPELFLEQPDVSFDVRTSLSMELDGNDIIETLSIEAKQSSQRINNELSVLPAKSLRDYQWSLRGSDDQVPINLPASVVTADDTINLGERNLRGKRLVGRRQYRIADQTVSLRLPTVVQAASQSAEVLLGTGLALKSRSASVELVPLEQSPDNAMGSAGIGSQGITRLRYDPGSQPRIEVERAEDDIGVSIVWQQDVSVTASSRGSDSIWALIRVSSSKPVEIDCDPDLQLASISLNGNNIDLNAVPQRPIRLPTEEGVNTIRLAWNRNQLEALWFRQCKIPQIDVSGVQVKSSYRLTASQDTFVPAAFFKSNSSVNTTDLSLVVRPGKVTTLVHRNLALAAGWLFAALFFSACWMVARYLPLAVTISVVLATTSMVLWWPWRLAIIGWLVLPAIAAMLLESSRILSARLSRTWPSKDAAEPESPETSSGSFDFSNTVKTLFVFVVVGLVYGAAPAQCQDRSSSRSSQPAIDVLVPIAADGAQAGDKVYIPNSVFQQLFSAPAEDELGRATIQNAVYRVELDDRANASPEIKAEYLVHVTDTNQIRLPFESKSVRRVMLRQGDEDRIITPTVRDRDGILLTLPPGDTFDLRLTLVPTVMELDQRRQLKLAIPSIAASRLFIDAAREIQLVRLAQCAGSLTADSTLRRWNAELGPVTEIDISYLAGTPNIDDSGKKLARRYWISVGKQHTSVDCEIELPLEVFPGETVQFEVLHPAIPRVVSPNWQIRQSTLLSPARRLITLVKVADIDRPIQLFWTLESKINDLTSTADSLPMLIPEVVTVDSTPATDPVFAIQHDRDLQVMQVDDSLVRAIESSEFLEYWSGDGDRGSIDKAFVSLGEFPALLLHSGKVGVPAVMQEHNLHVTSGRLELRYAASIAASVTHARNLSMRIPADMELQGLTVNGIEVESAPMNDKRVTEIALGEFDGTKPALIEALAFTSVRKNRETTLPVITLWPPLPSTSIYNLTRSIDVDVQVVSTPTAGVPEETEISQEQLAQERVPVISFKRKPEDDGASLSGFVIKTKQRKQKTDCEQFTTMSYDDGRWSMESLIRLDSSISPDFIDVQVPRRWSESLEVDGASVWIHQSSIDPSFELVRIAPDHKVGLLSIRGKLDTSDQGGLGVPQVSVLGPGTRNVVASVPKRATGQWKTRGVRETKLPDRWNDVIDDDEKRQNYQVQDQFSRSKWSVELQPLPNLKTIALAADAQIFLQESNALVLYRWDLIPGNLSSVAIQMPRDAEFLGAWTAGRPVKPSALAEAQMVETSAGESSPRDVALNQPDLLRLPLSLSRLSQSVEVLLSIPMKSKLEDYLPQLLSLRDEGLSVVQTVIPSQQQWVAVYSQTENAPPASEIASKMQPPATSNSTIMLDDARAISLAGAVVDAIDQSLETLAERPKAEVATWLLPWVARYQKICESRGHRFDWRWPLQESAATGSAAEVGGNPRPASETILASSTAAESWLQLDERMTTFIARFMPEEFSTNDPLFTVDRFEGYTLTAVSKISPVTPARPIQSMSSEMQDLRKFLGNSLTLIMVFGLVCLLLPFRRHVERIIVHPAVWLGLTGLFGLFVAPIPVAIALIVLAVTLPVITALETRQHS